MKVTKGHYIAGLVNDLVAMTLDHARDDSQCRDTPESERQRYVEVLHEIARVIDGGEVPAGALMLPPLDPVKRAVECEL